MLIILLLFYNLNLKKLIFLLKVLGIYYCTFTKNFDFIVNQIFYIDFNFKKLYLTTNFPDSFKLN